MGRITDCNRQKDAVSAIHLPAPNPPLADGASDRDDADTLSIRSRHTLGDLGSRTNTTTTASDEEDDDPWSAIPRRMPASLSTSMASGSIAMLTRAQRRQLLWRALAQFLALFAVCLVGLSATLWLALPVIAPEDRRALRIPRSFEELQALNSVLGHYRDSHFYRVLLSWVVVDVFLQAFSIPGSMYMSILAGALFGVPLALPLVCASVASGATLCYLISRTLRVVLLALPSWQARVEDWRQKLDEHKDDMLSYLIVLRMMPLPPHNIVNILSPHLGISISIFWLSTLFGILAVSVIHTTIGEKLDEMTSADDLNLVSLRNMFLLLGVCIAVLIPVVARKFGKVQALQNANEATHGPVYLAQEDGQAEPERDAQRLPYSFRHPSLLGARRLDDEEGIAQLESSQDVPRSEP
ncbi:hypothetical protein NDA13_006280 [Ustilago tritici]|nr:hypothetical protein NDA13_006280 [Ustilago tritici]